MSERTTPTDEPPVEIATRAPSDVLRLVVSLIVFIGLVVIGALFDEAIVGFAADLLAGLEALPDWLLVALGVVLRLLLLVVLVGGLAGALVAGRWRLLAMLALAAAIGAGLFLLVDPHVDHSELPTTDLPDEAGIFSDPGFPSAVAVAMVAAGVTAAGPWVARRWRRAGWALVLLLAATRLLVAEVSFDTVLAVTAGWVGGAAAIVVLGAPSRRPTTQQVIDGLEAVGVPLASLEKAGVDARGSTPYFGTDTEGRRLFVKALGADERSADLLFRMYRRLQPRDLGDEKAFSTLRRAVEHEALVALAARDIGIRTPRLVAFATAEPDACVLAYEGISGKSFDRLDASQVSDGILAAVWEQIALLRRHRIAHRDLRLANLFLADGDEVWMIDFGFSELAASDVLLATDLAELLASTSLQVGVDRAVAAARGAVEPAELASALDRLHPEYLAGATRTAYKADPARLRELRDAIHAVPKGDHPRGVMT
jgi:undecaprenyl-diphosphatase